jgi:hypothetical protein
MNYFDVSEGSTINVNKKINSIKTSNLYLENISTTKLFKLLVLEHNIKDSNLNDFVSENLQLKQIKIEEKYQNNGKNNELKENIGTAVTSGGSPEDFVKSSNGVIRGFLGSMGGGSNSNRIKDLVDDLLEICVW